MKIIYLLLLLPIVISGCFKQEVKNPALEKNQTDWQYNDWQTYRNENLGFEIKYPAAVDAISCEPVDGKYKIVTERIPVKIFEKNKTVYISTEYFYNPDGYNIYNQLYDKCEKIDKTLAILRTANPDDYNLRFWEIVIQNDIDSDAKLSVFLKEFYKGFSPNCQLGEIKPTKQDGVYDVITARDGKEFGDSDCYINARTVVKYYPKKSKIVAWVIGQEEVFWLDTKNNIAFDEDMVKSFKFLN